MDNIFIACSTKTLLCAIAYVKNGSCIKKGRENKWDRKSTWVSFYSATLKKAIGLFCSNIKKRTVENVASQPHLDWSLKVELKLLVQFLKSISNSIRRFMTVEDLSPSCPHPQKRAPKLSHQHLQHRQP